MHSVRQASAGSAPGRLAVGVLRPPPWWTAAARSWGTPAPGARPGPLPKMVGWLHVPAGAEMLVFDGVGRSSLHCPAWKMRSLRETILRRWGEVTHVARL